MKKFTLLLLAIVLCSFSGFAQVTVASYDFESGSTSPWYKWSSNFTASISANGEGYNAGYCAVLNVTTAGSGYSCQWVNDAFTYTNGNKYQITFWAKSSIDNLILQPVLQLKSDYSANYGANCSLTTTWQQFTTTITCTADRDRVLFQTGANLGTIYVDNIVITNMSQTSGINSSSESALAVSKDGSNFSFNQTLDKVSVFDMNGREILKASNRNSINLSAYPNGVYMVKAASGSQNYVTKIVK